MSDLLTIAIPSKGRLEESAKRAFADAGLALTRDDARGYRGRVKGMDAVQIQYVSAGEIAKRLADGSVHFGITGEDLLREEIPDMESAVQLCLPLGFGRADLVVAVPEAWVDVTNMFDLAEVASDFRVQNSRLLRVATKYTHLAADFFTRHNVIDIELVQSFGATEAAPLSGSAEAIVDITSSGATLAANDLRVLDDGIILKSEAHFAAALRADWSADAVRDSARHLLRRISAHQKARDFVELRFETPKPIDIDFECDPASTHYALDGRIVYRLIVGNDQLDALLDALNAREIAATVTRPDFIVGARNEAYDRLMGTVS